VLGVLTLADATRPFTEADERLLSNIASLTALALRSARLYEERSATYRELTLAQDHLVRTEKLRALGEMAAGVAHDFNNLLAVIVGRAELLLRRAQARSSPGPRDDSPGGARRRPDGPAHPGVHADASDAAVPAGRAPRHRARGRRDDPAALEGRCAEPRCRL
jgi:signal transduction histidine kinase